MLFATSACARGAGERADAAGHDANVDARRWHDAPADTFRLLPDAAIDAGCAISAGTTIALDGNGDYAKYPAAQQLAPGAMLGSDAAAVSWDRTKLYVTVVSSAFASAYEPLHVYVETDALASPVPSQGKEYSNLVPAIPFTASYLIAARRVTDSGSGPYDGVYVPNSAWTIRQTALQLGSDVFVSSDQTQLSIAVPWTALGGCPLAMRLAVHVVNGTAGNEWKDLLPSTHTPWQAPGGGYYQIDLTHAPAVTNWALH